MIDNRGGLWGRRRRIDLRRGLIDAVVRRGQRILSLGMLHVWLKGSHVGMSLALRLLGRWVVLEWQLGVVNLERGEG